MFKVIIARFQFAFIAGLVMIAHGLDPNAPSVTPFLLALHSDNWWAVVMVITIVLVGMELFFGSFGGMPTFAAGGCVGGVGSGAAKSNEAH